MSARVRWSLIIGAIAIFFSDVATPWECTKPGRFRDPEEDADSCAQYVTCVPDSAGEFSPRQEQCSPGNLFSAKYQRCISGDSCDALEDFYSIEYECKECGKFVNILSQDCRQYINCLRTKDQGVFIPIKQSCPKGQVFSAETQTCVDEDLYQCPLLLPTKFLSDFVCLDAGSYPDESVPNCRGYRVCSKLRNGTLVSKNFLCVDDAVFSEIDRKCVSPDKYVCPDDGDNDYTCRGIGRYPNMMSNTCKTYYNCVEGSNGEIQALLLTCPEGTIFSAITSKCVATSEYDCSSMLTETEPSDQHNPSIARQIAGDREDSTGCSALGSFANQEDEYCLTYYVCSLDSSGNWLKIIARCADGTVYSPEHKRCVENSEFICPPLTTISVVVEPSTSTLAADQPAAVQCAGVGRVLNTDDSSCRSYYLCSFNSEYELTRAVIVCPAGSLFSSDQKKCVKQDGSVQCPLARPGSAQVTTVLQDSMDESGDGTDGQPPNLLTTPISGDNTDDDEDGPIAETAELINTTMMPLSTSYEYPCTATGRFADINSVDCRSYFLCTENKAGSFVSIHLNCPAGMVFSRNNNKCIISVKYLC